MNREINTIGSKANDSVISREVVVIKAELERFSQAGPECGMSTG